MKYSQGEFHISSDISARRDHLQRRASRSARTSAGRGVIRLAEVRRCRRILVFLYLLFALEIAAAAVSSPVLAVRNVRVRGLQELPPEEARTITEITQVRPGTNWLLAPVSRLERRLMALPWVASAHVARAYPGSIVVHVTPRRPEFLVASEGKRFEVDATGVPIRPARPIAETRMPLLVLRGKLGLQLGISSTNAAFRAARQLLLNGRQDTPLRIASIEIDRNDNICLNMEDAVRVHFGSQEQSDSKVNLLVRIYRQDPKIGQRISEIDISCLQMPACIPRVADPGVPDPIFEAVPAVEAPAEQSLSNP